MARPKFCRRVSQEPAYSIFKPAGVPAKMLNEIVLSVDEFEAVRLADLEGLYQEEAAEKMNVSRQTFGRIIGSARQKIARVLCEGLALRIEGGEVELPDKRTFKCENCKRTWQEPYGTGRPEKCPKCDSKSFCRFENPDGFVGGGKGCNPRYSCPLKKDNKCSEFSDKNSEPSRETVKKGDSTS